MKPNSRFIVINAVALFVLLTLTAPHAEACKKKAAAPPPPGVIRDYIQKYEEQLKDLEAQQVKQQQKPALDAAPVPAAPAPAASAAAAAEAALTKKIKTIQLYIEQWKALLVKSEKYYKEQEERAARKATKKQSKNRKTANAGPAKAGDTGFEASSEETDKKAADEDEVQESFELPDNHDHEPENHQAEKPQETLNHNNQHGQHEEASAHSDQTKSEPQPASNAKKVPEQQPIDESTKEDDTKDTKAAETRESKRHHQRRRLG